MQTENYFGVLTDFIIYLLFSSRYKGLKQAISILTKYHYCINFVHTSSINKEIFSNDMREVHSHF